MSTLNIYSDEFAHAVAMAGLHARQEALAAGHEVVFRDESGRYVREMPDGRLFEIRFLPGQPRESHIVVLRELSTPAG